MATTKQTPANLAIVALAQSIAAQVQSMKTDADFSAHAATVGDLNGSVGALLAVQSQVEALQAQVAAVLALHRSK